MPLRELYKAPFPYFGGKSAAAKTIWEALGDVTHYIEPFGGSLAVLLRRPHLANRTNFSETVNDIDGLLVNAWRSIQYSPEATAEAASWPVIEADLHARHLALLKWKREKQLEHLMGDPHWHDPMLGGWWIWGASCWLGSGWCGEVGPWYANDDGWIAKKRNAGGIWRQIPHLSDHGQGVNHPAIRDDNCTSLTMPDVLDWFKYLSSRLRHVRILNGDWERAVSSGVAKSLTRNEATQKAVGIVLDPPYGQVGRDSVYAHENFDVAKDVREWCLTKAKPEHRIILCGFDDEHDELLAQGWRKVEWFKSGFLKGGYRSQNKDGTQQHRERLWLSPNCLSVEAI